MERVHLLLVVVAILCVSIASRHRIVEPWSQGMDPESEYRLVLVDESGNIRLHSLGSISTNVNNEVEKSHKTVTKVINDAYVTTTGHISNVKAYMDRGTSQLRATYDQRVSDGKRHLQTRKDQFYNVISGMKRREKWVPPPNHPPAFGSGCFSEGTLVAMEDGTCKKIEDVHINDILLGGHTVAATMIVRGGVKMMSIYGVKVSHDHAVQNTDTKSYVRVGDHHAASLLPEPLPVLYNLITEDHRIRIKGEDDKLVTFADYEEVDDTDEELSRFLQQMTSEDLEKGK